MNAEAHNPNPLQTGTRIAEYVITGVLGEGGFGIVYSALDERLQRTIAIKEYLPAAIAGRSNDLTVRVRSANNLDAFGKGLQSFMREATLLAQFSHPALIELYRVWEQNATAYIAMRLCAGHNARDVRRSMSEGMHVDQIRVLQQTVFGAVSTLHAKDVIHRDISPDNVMISPTGVATLLDLGAARMVLAGLTQALTTVLKPGYAPIEQYTDDGSWVQGPWTDVYGLAALIYFMVTGQPPAQAVARSLRCAEVFSQQFADVIAHALSVQPSVRTYCKAAYSSTCERCTRVRCDPTHHFESARRCRVTANRRRAPRVADKRQALVTRFARRGQKRAAIISACTLMHPNKINTTLL
jgi:serine/threonine protein kinase